MKLHFICRLGPSVKDWYGGNGSVKDLVNLYQKQVNEVLNMSHFASENKL